MNSKKVQPISKSMLHRLPFYLQCLKERAMKETHISAPVLAAEMQLNEVQVRKDLAAVSSKGGRPKTGYEIRLLIQEIEAFLGYQDVKTAVLVGVGHLGGALLHSREFKDYGLRIVAAFDGDAVLVDQEAAGVRIHAMDELVSICQECKAEIGIIAVPLESAQKVCDRLVAGGVGAIWNWAPVHLNVPEGVVVQNENMASSLAVLFYGLSGK